jgi:hypothetical protein
MLTAIEIENFKGFGPRQRIEFAPITLLFGPNSAGKSTIIQCLLYLQALLEHGEANVDRTVLGGQSVDLGGFGRFVHRLDVRRDIKIRAEFATSGSLERFGRLDDEIAFPDLDDDTASAWIEFTVRDRLGSALVDRVEIGIDATREPLVSLEWAHPQRLEDGRRARIYMNHPSLGNTAKSVADSWSVVALREPELVSVAANSRRGKGKSNPSKNSRASGLVPELAPVFLLEGRGPSALPPLAEPIRVRAQAGAAHTGQELVEIRAFLEMTVLGTARQLAAHLTEMLYVGPLRLVPPRGYLYERASPSRSWADGLAAWDALLRDRGALVRSLNSWLSDDRLRVKCQVEVHDLVLPYEDPGDGGGVEDIMIEDAWNVRDRVRRLVLRVGSDHALVLPSEVGTGVSQLIPVVVASIIPGVRLVVLEQPELHVHPAIQVGLGDLLIESSRERFFIIETHSEHLVLRLLRRIRETTEKSLGDDDPPLTKEKLSVVYVEPTAEGIVVSRLRVDDQGEFMDRWPRGFFGERMKELL